MDDIKIWYSYPDTHYICFNRGTRKVMWGLFGEVLQQHKFEFDDIQYQIGDGKLNKVILVSCNYCNYREHKSVTRMINNKWRLIL